MIIVHRGGGLGVIGIGLVSALLMNIVTNKFVDNVYYVNNIWPRFGALWLAGLGCFILGAVLKRHDAKKTKVAVKPFSVDMATIPPDAAGPSAMNHYLFFIPVTYWGYIYFALGIIFVVVSIRSSQG